MEKADSHIKGFELTPIEDLMRNGAYRNGTDVFSVHRADTYMIIYADKGAGKHTVDLVGYTMHPGAFLFVGPRQIMQFDRSKSYGGYILQFTASFLNPDNRSEETRALNRLFDNTSHTAGLDARRHREIITYFEFIQREISHAPDVFRGGIIRATLELLLLHAARLVAGKNSDNHASDSGYQHFRTFRSLLGKRIDASRNALDFAEEMGISYKYLNDLCKLHANCTAKDLIDRERIAEAQRLLVRELLSVRQTAERLGFNDVSNFRKYFRKFTGATPMTFRNDHV
jgi:AraC family transcriptional activator of pobA